MTRARRSPTFDYNKAAIPATEWCGCCCAPTAHSAAKQLQQDGAAEQLRESVLVVARLWRSRGHVAVVLQFQQLKAAATH
ncbi:hypothetical protein L3X38_017762 [Prunus dulcis]|uniref:Uncharacterized protein n=1 Tax=Prunus dulcis TaxID=3755 RepID=A0AAD4WAC7_PRUDU|nr:hypothetical protein L3X38_017762 [Prunus dulcis]